MKTCDEIDSLMTPYVDDEVDPAVRQAIDAHLGQCPPCHERARPNGPLGVWCGCQRVKTGSRWHSWMREAASTTAVTWPTCYMRSTAGRCPYSDVRHTERSIDVVGHQARLWSADDVG